jgi:hypothetical protein
MSDYSDLKPGLRWARHKKNFTVTKWTRWVVIEITGKFPFMKAEIVFDPGGDENTDTYLNLYDPTDWQFGPELEIPSEHWADIRRADEIREKYNLTLGKREDD